MLRDVFYYGKKPNVHPREQFAENLEDARQKCTTDHFWVINEFGDYRNFDWDFDFEFLPDEDVWAEEHNNVWPSQHQKDSGTWLCPKEHSDLIIYRCDVDPVYRKNEMQSDNWVELDLVDHNKFDFSWHPDPTDPPYIYKWGCKFFPVELKHVLEYRVPGATKEKYMNTVVELLPNQDCWVEHQAVDPNHFDFTWRPNPLDPPFIYVWGNKYIDGKLKPTIEYHCEGATDKKYMPEHVAVLPEWDKWVEIQAVDKSKFDFSWRPDPREPAYIYTWGNKHIDAELRPTLEYHCEGATDRKYLTNDVPVLPERDRWKIVKNIEMDSFDFTWRPDPREPPMTYVFGNNLYDPVKMPTIIYTMPEGHDTKYVDDIKAKLAPVPENYEHLEDSYLLDYSWQPDPDSPPFIYVWGNQWNKPEDKISVQYVVEGATEYKYMPERAVRRPSMDNWLVPSNIDLEGFDWSWEPDAGSPPYIYEFATVWNNRGGPRYVVPGATEFKFIEDIKARTKPVMNCWKLPEKIDLSSFDFSWVPHPDDPPYIYEFGTQWQKTGGPRYVLDDPIATKYVDLQKAKRQQNPSDSNWHVLDGFKIKSFDYSWHPDSTEEPYIYVFGNQWHPAEIEPTIEYRVPGATKKKYINDIVATLAESMDNWTVPDNIDTTEFDFSWRPDPHSPAYIYEFGTQWAKTGGPKYVVKGATTTKYEDTLKVKALPNKNNFVTMNGMDIKSFDYSWHPDTTDEPYVYVFGNQWFSAEKEPTIEYRMPLATKKKYVDTIVAILNENMDNWEIPNNVDKSKFDFSWHPDPDSPPYIYEFATTWNDRGGPKYIVPGATKYKYVDDIKAPLLPNLTNWEIPDNIDTTTFDFSWVPHPDAPPYIYEFATIWNDRGGPVYRVPNATEYKYIEDIKAKTLPNRTNWEVADNIDVSGFDFSWVPHPHAPAYIYQFGTLTNTTDGPRYVTPNNNGEIVYLERVETDVTIVAEYFITSTLDDLVKEHSGEVFWAKRKNIDYTNFDFNWRPESLRDLDYVQVFGSSDSEFTQTYFVNAVNYLLGKTQFKFIETVELTDTSLSQIFIKPDMFFVDKGNKESAARFEALKTKYGTRIQKTRYLNSWVDTINRCTNRATTEVIWVLNSELDYNDFNFDYYPNPWQMKMVHVFGTQWSHWGTTFLVNRESFPEDTKYIKIIEHLSNLNFVKSIRATATDCVHDIVLIDHGNKETELVYDLLVKKAGNRTVTKVSYQSSYFATIKKIIAQQQAKKENYIWVCSSVCDYSDFDFSYVIDPFTRDNLHVFPSGSQKFGDTFFFDVNHTHEIIFDMEELEEHKNLNFNPTVKSNRLPEPVIVVSADTHVNSIDKITDFPYATLITQGDENLEVPNIEPMNLWSPKTKNIIITTTGASRIIAPKEVKDYVKKELYDYPYIKRTPKLTKSMPMDIVFLSNGEKCADEHYDHLLKVTEGLPNRVVRVDGVNGRVAAYHAAAEASETPWMFTVFAKLKVSPKFDWNWQPDRMQVPKHYIFHAKNPVNGLTYGHQAMIAYNKKLTLANEGRGLDFTLDDEHEIVPLVSGTAQYNSDPFSTWRTAFREVLKLKSDDSEESRVRLEAWLTKADGEYGEYSIEGALDAEKYYQEINGDFDKLKLSYEWQWLRNYFDKK